MNQILKKAIFEGFDLETRGSTGHDLRISFLGSNAVRVDGCPVCLETDDRLIHAAAFAAGTAAYVLRLSSYRNFKRYVGAQIGIYNPQGDKVGEVSHLRNKEYIFVVSPDAIPTGVFERRSDEQLAML